MKILISYIILIISVLQLFSCKKESEKPSPTPHIEQDKSAELSIVWKNWIYNDSAGAFIYSPRFAGDYVAIYSFMPYHNNSGKLGMVIYDKETGEPHPAWNHEPNFNVNSTSDWEIGGENKDIVVILSGRTLYAYDINTAQEIWTKYSGTEEVFMPEINSFGDDLFVGIKPEGIENAWGKLVKMNIKTGKQEEILKIDSVSGYSVLLYPPSIEIMPSGDTLLIFQNRQLNFGTSDGKIDIYAYNMTADSMLWIVDDLTSSGNSSVMEGIITEDHKYLFQGSKSIHCIDITNGEILWEDKYQIASFFQTHNLYADGKVFLNSETGAIICYDVASGNRLWYNTKEDATPAGETMGYYDGKLYMSAIPTENQGIPVEHSFSFKCISASNGEVLWSSKRGSSGVIIDQQTGYLYVGTGFTLMCIDLNKTPVMK